LLFETPFSQDSDEWLLLLSAAGNPDFLWQFVVHYFFVGASPWLGPVIIAAIEQRLGFLATPSALSLLASVAPPSLPLPPAAPENADSDSTAAFRLLTALPGDRDFARLQPLVVPGAIAPRAALESVAVAAFIRHPLLEEVARLFLTAAPAFARAAAAVFLRSGSQALGAAAAPFASADAALAVQAVTAGTLPLSFLATFPPTTDFWIAAAQGRASDSPPSTDSVVEAVRFGGAEAFAAVAAAIPRLIRPETVLAAACEDFQRALSLPGVPELLARGLPETAALPQRVAADSPSFVRALLALETEARK
jgi:hypothetical protein